MMTESQVGHTLSESQSKQNPKYSLSSGPRGYGLPAVRASVHPEKDTGATEDTEVDPRGHFPMLLQMPCHFSLRDYR